jgi:hypothetical protein
MDGAEAARLLGIAPDVRSLTPSHLRKYYLKRALASHPDKNPGDSHAAENFAKLQEAYATLLRGVAAVDTASQERAHSDAILDLFLRALRGEDVEKELQGLGVYRPSAQFGVDLAVPFDRRPPPPQDPDDGPVDVNEAINEAFAAAGLDAEGNPLEGWARPPTCDLEDLF